MVIPATTAYRAISLVKGSKKKQKSNFRKTKLSTGVRVTRWMVDYFFPSPKSSHIISAAQTCTFIVNIVPQRIVCK